MLFKTVSLEKQTPPTLLHVNYKKKRLLKPTSYLEIYIYLIVNHIYR
jgi:hypothetical protein